jgi:parallel beta-helix repeat protein
VEPVSTPEAMKVPKTPNAILLVTILALLAGVYAVWSFLDEPPDPMSFALNERGGECIKLGVWNAETTTCTLSGTPLTGTRILIIGDGITLDGNGKSLLGTGEGIAVGVYDSLKVEVRDLAITGYRAGVQLGNTESARLHQLAISEMSQGGISLRSGARHNVIENNRIGPMEGHGIDAVNADGNQIIGNHIYETKDGIRLQNGFGNVISGNSFVRNRVEGVDFHASGTNRVVLNDFLTVDEIPIIDQNAERINFYHTSSGGNHYSVFDEPSEGCHDTNGDGFCDRPYTFHGGEDQRPLVSNRGQNQ